MPLKHEVPSAEYMVELKEVAKQAAEFCEFLKQANLPLPPRFPINSLKERCENLQRLPIGTAEGSISTLISAHQRLMAVRNRFILAKDDDGKSLNPDDPPPNFRGEQLDREMLALYGAVGSAIEHYRLESGEEPQTDISSEVEIKPKTGTLNDPISRARDAEKDLATASETLSDFDDSSSEFDNFKRTLEDGRTQVCDGRTELEEDQPRPGILERVGIAAIETGKVLTKCGRASQVCVDTWQEIERILLRTIPDILVEAGTGFKRAGKLLRGEHPDTRDPTQSSTSNTEPLFDYVEVYNKLLSGLHIPDKWAPRIVSLDFVLKNPHHLAEKVSKVSGDPKNFRNVQLLSNLTQLERLNLRGTKVEDVEALAKLETLKKLNVYDTNVKSVSSLAHLIANGLTVYGPDE